jgi:hypothetical protein
MTSLCRALPEGNMCSNIVTSVVLLLPLLLLLLLLLQLPAEAGSCHCLCWREAAPGLPPLLAVGHSRGSSVWAYQQPSMQWKVRVTDIKCCFVGIQFAACLF